MVDDLYLLPIYILKMHVIFKLQGLPADIGALKDRERLQRLRALRRRLPCLQVLRLPDQLRNLRVRETRLKLRKLLFCRLLLLLRETVLRREDDDSAARVREKLFLHELLKVPVLRVAPQLLVGRERLQRVKWRVVVIEPGSEHIDAVHESLRVGRVVRLAELELKVV